MDWNSFISFTSINHRCKTNNQTIIFSFNSIQSNPIQSNPIHKNLAASTNKQLKFRCQPLGFSYLGSRDLRITKNLSDEKWLFISIKIPPSISLFYSSSLYSDNIQKEIDGSKIHQVVHYKNNIPYMIIYPYDSTIHQVVQLFYVLHVLSVT